MPIKIVIKLFFLSFVASYMLHVVSVNALTLQSPRFRIEEGKIEPFQKKEPESKPFTYTLEDVFGSEKQKEFDDQGYTIINQEKTDGKNQVIFSNSDSNLEFSDLAPSKAQTKSIQLKLNCQSDNKFTLTAIQEYLPKTLSGDILPDTSCDGADQSCSLKIAKEWKSNASFGIGYNVGGNGFRPFANQNLGHEQQSIANLDCQNNPSTNLNVKINIDKTQVNKSFESIIDLVVFLKI